MTLSTTEQPHAAHSIPLHSSQGEAQQNNPSLVILTDGGVDLHPPCEGYEVRIPVHCKVEKPRWEAAHQLPSFPYRLTHEDRKERPSAERDWVKGMLRDVVGLKGVKWESLGEYGFWKFRFAFRRQIQIVEGIENDDFRPEREKNFFSCGAWKSRGRKIKYVDGELRLSCRSCSDRGCPKCFDRDKERTATKYFKKIVGASEAQGIKRFWGIVITLPVPQEASVPAGSELRKIALDVIKKFLRRLFGLKTRDGLFSYCNVHAVGDNNLFRDRFHFHCGVLPIATRKNKSGEIELVKCDFKTFKADLDRARELLADHLESVFPNFDRSLTQLHMDPFVLRKDKKSRAKLNHRLRYDLRGFGKDIERAPILFDPIQELVVVKQGKDGYGVFTLSQLAKRWKWIRDQRDFRYWGILHQWSKYEELLGVEFVPDPEPEIEDEANITIIRSGGRQWNSKKRCVEWIDEKMAIDENGTVIQGIKWGRKGSEGFWRPRISAPPDENRET